MEDKEMLKNTIIFCVGFLLGAVITTITLIYLDSNGLI